MTSSNGNIFRVTGYCEGNSPVTGEFPAQRPVTWSFDVSFDLCLNKRLSKQSWRWWFETPSGPLRHHCNKEIAHWSRDKLAANLQTTGVFFTIIGPNSMKSLQKYNVFKNIWYLVFVLWWPWRDISTYFFNTLNILYGLWTNMWLCIHI